MITRVKSVFNWVKTHSPLKLRDIAIASTALAAFIVAVPIVTYFYFAQDLVSADTIMNRKDTGVVLLDRNATPFFTLFQANYSAVVPLSRIPKVTQEAVIASEDKGFYRHPGFSVSSVIRAAVADFNSQELSQGGSTITQQLVKNSLLNSNKDFLRKYQELVLAQELERRYSKDQILGMYFNSVYFGAGAFGIQEAAKIYFGEDARDLNLAQSGLLIGLLPAPSRLSPLGGDFSEARLHQKTVLAKMVQQGYISQAQADSAYNQKLTFAQNQSDLNTVAPHFALMVRRELIDKYGEEQVARSGFRVKTTLDLDWQRIAQQVVRKRVVALARDNVSNGAAVVMDPKTGEILALVGSVDWNNPDFGKVNMATSPRQSGSSFKPIVYSAAFEQGLITPATILQDVPTKFSTGPGRPPYAPLDYDRRWRGPVTARRALDNSLNVPAVEVMQKVGVVGALEMAGRLGITTLGDDPSNYGLSLVLGTGGVKLTELTDVYATFANQGNYNPPTDILEIDDKYGNQIYSYSPTDQPVLEPRVAFLISSILSDNQTRAEEFGNALTISRPAAVKTGTTEDYRDSLTLGYTPSLTVGVWVGNNYNQPMDGIAGSLGAAPIWRDLMETYLKDTPVEKFTQPDGVVSGYVCRSNELKASGASSSAAVYKEYFLNGTEPTQLCFNPKSPTHPSPSISPTPTPSSLSPTAIKSYKKITLLEDNISL